MNLNVLTRKVASLRKAQADLSALKPTNKRGRAICEALISHISLDIALEVADHLSPEVPVVEPQQSLDLPQPSDKKGAK